MATELKVTQIKSGIGTKTIKTTPVVKETLKETPKETPKETTKACDPFANPRGCGGK